VRPISCFAINKIKQTISNSKILNTNKISNNCSVHALQYIIQFFWFSFKWPLYVSHMGDISSKNILHGNQLEIITKLLLFKTQYYSLYLAWMIQWFWNQLNYGEHYLRVTVTLESDSDHWNSYYRPITMWKERWKISGTQV